MDTTAHLLLTLAVVIMLGRLVGWVFAHIGQPPVIGEVIAGIMLGPSLLARLVPDGPAWLLPPAVAPFLREIAQLGVILYMFLVGLELNLSQVRQRAAAALVVAHASIIVPFALGAGLALFLHADLCPAGVPLGSFTLFMGVAMAITAFPVLARILTDRGMTRSDLGVMALTCAAIGDVTAWCLLAVVVGVARAEVQGAIFIVLGAVIYAVGMVLIVRPIARRFAAHHNGDGLSGGVIALVLVALLLSSLATDLIGIHALFGAFFLGAVIPHDSAIARTFTHKLHELVTILLLPAFFAFTGMRTEIGLVASVHDWLVCGVIIVVATAGKFGGAFLSARLVGISWHNAMGLGLLMNTRGLMELIALNIGLDLGVISPTLFAMMVLMALVTTMATGPLLHSLGLVPKVAGEDESAVAGSARLNGSASARRVEAPLA
jgi:Kef-type K+ transport system membrane component KefB